MNTLKTDVLVVGGGTGGTAAAIQAARRGAQVVLVSEFPWLGGMLTSAGVSAPDGNELLAFQTGIWGALLRELEQQQPGGLDHAWVSFFTFEPAIAAQIFADWVAELPNLKWIQGQVPLAVVRQGDRLTAVRFADLTVEAKLVLDGTELGDLLALAEVPHRWGWEFAAAWGEPSAPTQPTELTTQYAVQAPTWVVMLQDFGEGVEAPEIPAPPNFQPDLFLGAWDDYGADAFLNYGRLPGDRFMINWPPHGNDYGHQVERLIQSSADHAAFLQAARWHAQGFARFIQLHLGRRYGLATAMFPDLGYGLGGGAFALHPYYRESRRLQGVATVKERDILPVADGRVAPLPRNLAGAVDAVAIANYANDHHYPGFDFPLQPKSIRWGGRWTGTPFALPYGCLVPATVEGLLVCEKNISVSHIANGATRLQPAVLGLGQAAGMAAALCIEQNCDPRQLPVRLLQAALLEDAIAPAAVIPLFNLPPDHPDWQHWQRYYLEYPDTYPTDGNVPDLTVSTNPHKSGASDGLEEVNLAQYQSFIGTFCRQGEQLYEFMLESEQAIAPAGLQFPQSPQSLQSLALPPAQAISLVTLRAEIDHQLQHLPSPQRLVVSGRLNRSGRWLLVEAVALLNQ